MVVFCHDFLNFIQSVYCHTVVCRHGFFHKAGAHTFTNHFQKSVSVYDMYFLSYVWFFSLFLSLHGFCKYVCAKIYSKTIAKIFLKSHSIPISNFSCMFLNPNIFFPIWVLIVLIYWIRETSRNKVKKPFCYQKLFQLFTVWTNCSTDLKIFGNSRP